ncbi:MAG TPA: DUF3617 family protein [Gemmatimonadaceae bacterium]|nr:DUF3617 family protein [Gemmatimonadaceae bacterium]
MANSPTRRAIHLALLTGLTVSVAPPLRAADRLTAGQYEFTATTSGKTRTSAQCFTADDAKAINADTKAGRDYAEKAAKGACTIRTYDATGDTVSYTMACGESVTTISATYHGDSFEGDTTTVVGTSIAKATHTQAKRVGICK